MCVRYGWQVGKSMKKERKAVEGKHHATEAKKAEKAYKAAQKKVKDMKKKSEGGRGPYE